MATWATPNRRLGSPFRIDRLQRRQVAFAAKLEALVAKKKITRRQVAG
jgi:hypothetical protein